mmetsp:Transcript_30245/g.64863  ORF Transcript_30245/g.64863 Transcript_30245/m.64863 type:complete len:99 (+) Transcript_30245:197-493(+)
MAEGGYPFHGAATEILRGRTGRRQQAMGGEQQKRKAPYRPAANNRKEDQLAGSAVRFPNGNKHRTKTKDRSALAPRNRGTPWSSFGIGLDAPSETAPL